MTQAEAITILKTGANVFLTGEPGSGKTHTINQYVAYLRSRGVEPAITASTGIAATHIGGMTIHSWSGIGIRRDLSAYDIDRIGQNRNVVRRISSARVLIIDEVSMLSAGTLSMIDAVCREVKRNREPFGGLQVILVGDFFQLPPVQRREDVGDGQGLFVSDAEKQQFAFFAPVWDALNPLVCYLSEQHRQEDAAFLGFLSAVRRAVVGEEHRQLLRRRYRPKPETGITQLYSHNADVDKINGEHLARLSGEAKVFEMEDRGSENLVAALKRGCLSPEKLLLKIGARVMFTKNDMERKFVNGTLGTVTGFVANGYPMVKTHAGRNVCAEPDEWHIEDGGRILARITQIPLRLAWAMTVHKSQGMSLDAAHMDLSDAFEYGQGYVALSRVRTLDGLSLAGLNERALEVHPEISAKDGEFREISQSVRETFSKIPVSELETMCVNFIRDCGGSVVPVKEDTQKQVRPSTSDVTKELALQKLSVEEMAVERGVTAETIIQHLEKLVLEGKIDPDRDIVHLKPTSERYKKIKKAFETIYAKEKKILLAPAREILGEDYSYNELRLARLSMKL